MTPEKLAELEALAGKATVGPWNVDESRNGAHNQNIESAEVVRMDNGKPVAWLHITAWKQDRRDARPDAHFIAASRTAVPELIAEVRRLAAENRALLDLLARARKWASLEVVRLRDADEFERDMQAIEATLSATTPEKP